MKRLVIVFLLSQFTFAAFAQDVTQPKSFMDDPLAHPMMPLYVVLGLMILVMLLIAVTGIYMIRIINMLTEQSERQRAEKSGLVYVARPGWWSRFSRQMNASVPLEEESTIELDHNYDGIKELDNHLPPWWKWLFYATIAWAAVYLVVYHVSDAYPLMIQEYDDEMASAAEEARKIKAAMPQEAIDENSLTYSPDAAILGKGKEVFNNLNCGSCHRADGGGNAIGPNLTDEFWIHGGSVAQVFQTIKNGAVEKGMPAWGKSLSPQDVRNVTFYIMSLQGTNPANAKAPQGEKYIEPVAAPGTADSTAVQASL